MKYGTILFLLFTLSAGSGFSQTIPLGFPVLNEYLRREQVLGNLNPDFSFNYRPILVEKAFPELNSPFVVDSTDGYQKKVRIFDEKSGNFKFSILPIQLNTVYNSHHPYSWGDGAILPAKGIQTLLSAGFFVKWGILRIGLNPQFHYAENSAFEEYPEDAPFEYFQRLRRGSFGLDTPVRFGQTSITRVLPGNSYAYLNFGSFSTGLSTENIWWGPGRKNALHLSDNAQGFLHYTIKTSKPAKTFIGNFEGQYFMAKLDGSKRPHFSDNAYSELLPSKNDSTWRYFTGISFSYNPKWVPSLFMGISRTFQIYRSDMDDDLRAWFPIFDPIPKEGTGVIENILLREDQHLSFFARYVIPVAKTELYFEYIRNDHSLSWREAFLNPDHSRGYLIGFSKYFQAWGNSNIEILGEMLHTQISINNIIRWTGPPNNGLGLFDNYQVTHGLTNRGEILGSHGGTSGNIYSMSAAVINKFNKFGIELERIERDKNFYNLAYSSSIDVSPWIDSSIGIIAEAFKNGFFITANIKTIHTLNYNFYNSKLDNSIFTEQNSKFSLYTKINVAYTF
jgi:hypothetical protein